MAACEAPKRCTAQICGITMQSTFATACVAAVSTACARSLQQASVAVAGVRTSREAADAYDKALAAAEAVPKKVERLFSPRLNRIYCA